MRAWRGVVVGMVGLCCVGIAGCGGGASGTKYVDREPLPQDTMTVRMHEVGVHGGRFYVGATAGPKTFNAPMANETSSNDVCNQMYTALADIDYGTLQDVPLAAKSWEFSADQRTVTFHLRHGMRFSDGHPMTSADVAFSFAVTLDDSLHPSAQEGLTYVDPATGRRSKFAYAAPDSYTFTVTAPRPYAMMLSATSSVRILPRHVLEPAFRAGRFASAYSIDTKPESLVTSGPWRLKEYLTGQKLVLERNPYWFGVDAKGQRLPYLDQIVFIVAADQNTAKLKFQSGELDGLDNVRPEDYRSYQDGAAKGGYTFYDVGPSFNTNFMWFNLNRARVDGGGVKAGDPAVGAVKYAWFRSPAFRRAVSKAIDREALIRGPFRGYGYKNWCTLTSGNKVWYDSTIVGADYDPDGAKALLAGLGMKDRDGNGVLEDAQGHPVSFSVVTNADNNVRKEMLNLIKDDLAKVGVEVVPNPLDFNTLVTHTRNDFQYDAALLGLGSAVPAEPGMGQNVWRSSGLTHYWHIKQAKPETPEEAKVDQLMDDIVYKTEPAARRAAWHDLMSIVNDQCWFVWLPVQHMMLPVHSKFGNVEPSPMPHRILWNSDRIFVKPGQGN